MTTIPSLTLVKSPFKAVAEYPPTLPYIGQDEAYHRLQDFTQSIHDEQQSHFLALFGAWAIGKSRLAHELIAQFCGQNVGWTLTSGKLAEPLLLPLQDGGDILPLFVSFVDAIRFQKFGLEAEVAMGKLTCAAMASLTDESQRRGSHYYLLNALRTALLDVSPNFDFDRLNEIATDTSRNYAERAERIVTALGQMTGERVRRVLVIVDEVESSAEINPFADEIGKEITERPIPPRTIRDLYSGVKEASNTNAYPCLNFLFFNTDVTKRLTHMDALDRRMGTADLQQASATDLERLLDAIRQTNYPLTGMLDDLARRAFFAADRNFGWFSFIMNKAHRALVDTPALSIDGVFADVCQRTGKVFQPSVFEDRDIHPAALKDAMRRVIYNQIPTTLGDLKIDPALRPAMLEYVDPFQTHFIGDAAIVSVSADALTRELLATNLYSSEKQPTLTGEGSARFDPAKVLDSLRTFAWIADAGATGADVHLWIYTDDADFENQVGFAYSNFGVDLSAVTVRRVHALLMDRYRVRSELQLVAPTMALLRRFNDRWGKAAANDWLKDANDWARLINTIENSPQLNDQRMLQGIANVLFDTPQPVNPSPYDGVSGHCLTLKLESYEPVFNVTSRNQLVLLKARETPQSVVDDLRAIKQRVPILLIFGHANQQKAWEQHIRESHDEHLAVAVIPHVVEPQTREWEFYVRFALREIPDGFKPGEMNQRGKDLRGEFGDVLREAFRQWLKSAEERGYVLRPFFPARSATSPLFRDFVQAWAALVRAGGMAPLGAQAASVEKGLEDYRRDQQTGDTLQLTEGDGQSLHAVIPAVMPHVLDVLRTRPYKLAELGDDLFYIRSRSAANYPSNIPGVLEQLLTLLQEIGVVDIDAQGRYMARTVAVFATQFDHAFQRLGADSGVLSGYVSQVASLSGPIKALAQHLKVNEAQLNLLKTQSLRPQQERLGKLPLDCLTVMPPDEQSYREVAQGIGAVSTALDEVFGKAGAASAPPPIDPGTLQHNIDDIVADNTYGQYSIEYRVAFLRQLQEYLNSADQDLRARLNEAKTHVVGMGADFPERPLLSLLDGVQADLDGRLPDNKLAGQLRQQQQDATLKVLKDAGRLSDVLIKLDWYTRHLDDQNAEGWWARYATAREHWRVVREKFEQVEASWRQLEEYFAGTPEDHIIKFTGAELAEDMKDLLELVESFIERENAPNVSMDDLADEITAIRERCTSAEERIQTARKDADAEIVDELKNSNDEAVRHLAARLNKENILPDQQRALHARTHHEAHEALTSYKQKVADVGRSLCEHDGFYDRYLQIYRDSQQGITGDQIYKKYDEKILQELNARHLITIRNVVEL